MVCAVVSARISPNFIEKIHSVRLIPRVARALDLNIVADFISEACMCLPGTIVAESGDLYNLEIWRVKSILGQGLQVSRDHRGEDGDRDGSSYLGGGTKAYH